MFKDYFVAKFPENYPWYKKGAANFIYVAGNIVIHRRNNLLTEIDRINLEKVLKPGDVLTVGNLRRLYSVVIRKPVTHAILYLEKDKFIHVTGNGVEYTTMDYIFQTYDTFAVFRMKKHDETVIRSVLNYTKNQIGKPYNFGFRNSDEKYFCTQLINEAYQESGYKTSLKTNQDGRLKIPLSPADFLKGNFSLVLTSLNLEHSENKFVLKKSLLNE